MYLVWNKFICKGTLLKLSIIAALLYFPFIFYNICYGKSEVKFKLKLLVSKASIRSSYFNSKDFFQMFIASTKIMFRGRLKLKFFRSMDIMQEWPTNKPNFLFKETQDFNNIIHIGPQEAIVFTDNISVYLDCFCSVQDMFKWLSNGHVIVYAVEPQNFFVTKKFNFSTWCYCWSFC